MNRQPKPYLFKLLSKNPVVIKDVFVHHDILYVALDGKSVAVYKKVFNMYIRCDHDVMVAINNDDEYIRESFCKKDWDRITDAIKALGDRG